MIEVTEIYDVDFGQLDIELKAERLANNRLNVSSNNSTQTISLLQISYASSRAQTLFKPSLPTKC